MGAHLIDGEFQSDKYPSTPRGKVPLSVKDKTAQDLLWKYAQRRRAVDPEFSDDLETALHLAGFEPPTRLAAGAPAKGYVVRWTDADGACEVGPMPLDVAMGAWRSQATQKEARILAVAEDGTETALPTYEEAFVAHQRAQAALDAIVGQMRGMSLRPRMFGDAQAVEMQAHGLTRLRRTLLGAPPDERARPDRVAGVYPTLHFERFGFNACYACSLIGEVEHEDADVAIGEFIGEWWRREQEAVPDPRRDERAEEERLAAARARVLACPAGPQRTKARERMRLSWNGADHAVKHHGCTVDGSEVVWPGDGERWPMSAAARGGATS